MSKYGKMVIWMGIILMALQVAAEWPFIRKQIFTNSSGGASTGSGSFTLNPLPFPFTFLPLPGSGKHLFSANTPPNYHVKTQ